MPDASRTQLCWPCGLCAHQGVQHPGKWVAVPLAQSTAPWRTLLNALPTDVPRAIEYPLIHDDLTGYTRQELDALRVATVI